MIFLPYRREDAVDYAHRWAYYRNPEYYDFNDIGGDCTNFASQCIYAGTGVMNFTPTYGWYYISPDDRTPSWTGVEYLYNFLTRQTPSLGPVCMETPDLSIAEPGDVIQLRFSGEVFQHSPVVVATDGSGDPARILLAAHSNDVDYRPLDTYRFDAYRVLHITGCYAEETGESI